MIIAMNIDSPRGDVNFIFINTKYFRPAESNNESSEVCAHLLPVTYLI